MFHHVSYIEIAIKNPYLNRLTIYFTFYNRRIYMCVLKGIVKLALNLTEKKKIEFFSDRILKWMNMRWG